MAASGKWMSREAGSLGFQLATCSGEVKLSPKLGGRDPSGELVSDSEKQESLE